MKVLLDTNICIHVIKQQPRALIDKLLASRAEDIGISVVTVAELRYGASKSKQAKRNHEALDLFLSPFEIVAFEPLAAIAYGDIRAVLEKQGRPIGPMDLLIAAQAVSLNLGLISNNVREFGRVPGLNVESWL